MAPRAPRDSRMASAATVTLQKSIDGGQEIDIVIAAWNAVSRDVPYRARLHAGRSPQRFNQSATRGWLSSLMPSLVPNISQLAAGISTTEKASSRYSRFWRRACSASSPRMNCDRLYSAHALLRSSGLYENGVSSPWYRYCIM